MARTSRIIGGSLGAAFLGATLMRGLIAAYGDVDTVLAWVPAPVSRFIASPNGAVFLVVSGLVLLFLALRYQPRPRPRLVVGYDGNGAAEDPFFVKNDGNETALDIRIETAILDGKPVTFDCSGTHLTAQDKAALRFYRHPDRLDAGFMWRAIETIGAAKRSGVASPEMRVPIRIRYADHDGHDYVSRFDVVVGVEPYKDGQRITPVRVESARR